MSHPTTSIRQQYSFLSLFNLHPQNHRLHSSLHAPMSSTSNHPLHPKPHVVTGYPAAPTTTTSSAYPYYPHNPNPNPNPHPYYPNPNPNLFLRRILAFAVAVFLVVASVTLIVYLVLRPKLPSFAVSSLAVSAFNISSSNSLSANFDLRLTVRNPNRKLRAAYDQVAAGVLYYDDVIAETTMPPFYQGTGNVTEVRASLAAVGEYVGEDVVKGMREEKGSGDGVVRFSVRVYAIARFNVGGWRTRNHVLRVFCEGIGVGFKNGTDGVGSMVGPAKECEVGL